MLNAMRLCAQGEKATKQKTEWNRCCPFVGDETKKKKKKETKKHRRRGGN